MKPGDKECTNDGFLWESMDKDIADLLSGGTVVHDENGNRVPLLDVPGGGIVHETRITTKELIEFYSNLHDIFKKLFLSIKHTP